MKKLIRQFTHLFFGANKSTVLAQADELIEQGNLLEDEHQPEAALEQYRTAVRLAPDHARAHLNAGNALVALGRPEQAIAYYRDAIRLDPGYVHAHFNLGRALQDDQRPEEAMGAYEEALRQDPALAEAHVALGCVFEDQGKTDQAIAAYKKALNINPHLAGAHYNLGRLLITRHEIGDALKELGYALELEPDSALTHWQIGIAYSKVGLNDKTHTYYRHARTLDPSNYAYHSILLFNMNNLANISDNELFSEHLAYNENFCGGYEPPASYPNSLDSNRRLRIGYVSGDFRQHPVLRFIEPLLEKHHRDQVEVYCYNAFETPDVATEKLKRIADQWRDTAGLDDDTTAQLIRDDQIDILVDLSGHTGYQRLAVFARKPAPVQATWLGYLATTGLKAMDYRICDHFTDPPGLTEKYHTEKLARLPDCQWCYRPPRNLPSPTALPMLANDYITFGSFNNIAKLNDQVLSLWSRLLLAVPSAKLLIAAMPDSELAVQRISDVLEHSGIPRERLDFRGRQPSDEYYHTCQEADIALDPFPYNGGTTSIDLLCLGVPIITLAGTRSIARGGVTLLSNLGLTEFIATSEQEYIEIALYWATHVAELAQLRAALPTRVAQSPIRNEERFASEMEALYREMWTAWIRQVSPSRGSPENSDSVKNGKRTATPPCCFQPLNRPGFRRGSVV